MEKLNVAKYAMVIDSFKCIDCKACLVACKVENDVPAGFWRNWIISPGAPQDRRIHFQPGQCMQCDKPSCVAACPVGATFKQVNGLVAIVPVKCIGCGNCVTACPYGARYRNPKKRIADKCDFCAHRLKRGEEPACVATCPTRARIFGDRNDPQSQVSRLLQQTQLVRLINPLINTQPRIYYTAGTQPMDWPREPTLPGQVHMPAGFWKTG